MIDIFLLEILRGCPKALQDTLLTGPLRNSQTEAGSKKNKNLINVNLQSVSWMITTYYFY